MEVFCFRTGGAENIQAFNARLADFASQNAVVGIVSSVIGTTLVMSLSLEADMVASPVVVRPVVIAIEESYEVGLENMLTELINAAKAEDNPEANVCSMPLEIKMLPAPSGTVLGYAVLQIVIGMLEGEA